MDIDEKPGGALHPEPKPRDALVALARAQDMKRQKNIGKSQAGKALSSGRPMGRVPGGVYNPEFCRAVIIGGGSGYSEAEMAVLCCGVGRTAMRKWAKQYPEFGQALELAREASLVWWEGQGRQNLKRPNFNTNLYNKIISCRFRNDGYSERVTVDGDPDAPVNVVHTVKRIIIRPK